MSYENLYQSGGNMGLHCLNRYFKWRIRESILNPMLGDKTALPISGLILSAMIFVITTLCINRFKAADSQTYIKISLFWGLLTLGFEYGVGYFVLHQPIEHIHRVFNLQQVNLFSLALLTSIIAPWLVAKTKHLS